MSEGTIAGLQPRLPWPLRRWPWWTEPIRAERLAALRIGLAAVVFLDVVTTYGPWATDLYGQNGLGSAEVFADQRGGHWHWSVLAGVQDPRIVNLAILAWEGCALLLLAGCWSRASASGAWALSVSFYNLNYFANNAGDAVRIGILFYLMVTPCGAVWSVDAWRQRRRRGPRGPVFIHPWALRLLFVQLVLIYFFNGVHKLLGPQWRAGDTLHYVLADLKQARWSYAELPVPYLASRLLTWIVLAWELTFPILVLQPWTRAAALFLGVGFHLGIGITLELGGFAWYMLCLYLPLVPWEWLADRRRGAAR